MEQRSIRQVAAWTAGAYDGPDLSVCGVSVDSRAVRPGDLFVALRGVRHDGHGFVGEAFASGASAALVERPDIAEEQRGLGRPVILVPDVRAALGALARGYRDSLDLTVVAVTGSCGKTTTKEMLALVLGEGCAVSPKSFNNDIGVPLTLLGATRHDKVCVVEMGTNAPGEIAALCRIARPDVGVVLNVGEAHLEKLGDLDGVAREKAALVEALGPEGCAILNHDDRRTLAMAARCRGYVITFGTTPEADVFARPLPGHARGIGFLLFQRRRVRIPVLGRHNVHNALAAASVALWLRRDPWEICERLETYRGVPMRLASEEIAQVRFILDAYNANPSSMEAALREMALLGSSGRRILVLGDMLELGEREEALHERIGRAAAASGADLLWAVGPRSAAAARAAREAGMADVYWSPDVDAAIARPPIRPRRRDRILFKASRGMQLERLCDALKEAVRDRQRTRGAHAPAGKDASEPAAEPLPT